MFFIVTAGNVHDCGAFDDCFKAFLARIDRLSWRKRLVALAGDKGYDSRRIRRLCRRHGLLPVIPKRRGKDGRRRRNPGFDKAKYRGRNVVERCILWLKNCRRLATRYEKLKATYEAMVNMASIRRLLRVTRAA